MFCLPLFSKAGHVQERSCSFHSQELDDVCSSACRCDRLASGAIEECFRNPPASEWCGSRLRRSIEVALALVALTICAAPMLVLAVLVGITSEGDVLFRQQRVGLKGRLFTLYKFRSMAVSNGGKTGPGLTKAGDMRVTPLGRFMRKFKLDELPQFYNVLIGDMSLIGPRPKLPQYVALSRMPYRPGITGAATLAFRNEEEMLRGLEAQEIEQFYEAQIKPLKARLDACYMCNATPGSDFRILAGTFLSCAFPELVPMANPAVSEVAGQD